MSLTFNEKLLTIGIRLADTRLRARKERVSVDLERTLLLACGEVPGDPRLLSLLFSWMEVHREHVITEKLRKLHDAAGKEGSGIPWLSALAAYALDRGSHKWRLLLRRLRKPLHLFPK